MSSSVIFRQSADAFVQLLAQVKPEQWDLNGLGVWSVRSLAGHTARAILTVENYLGQEEPGDVTIPSAERYYTGAMSQFTDPSAVAERGVEAGIWLGDDPVSTVSSALARAMSSIDSQPSNRIVSIGGMGILLTEYLRTRIFELVVHTIDLSRATGIDSGLPDEAIADAVALAGAVATARGAGEQLLFSLTGRGALPEGFSVV